MTKVADRRGDLFDNGGRSDFSMVNLKCYAPCGFTQLCLIACPNNRALDQTGTLQCSSNLELSDDGELLTIEFAMQSVPQQHERDAPEVS